METKKLIRYLQDFNPHCEHITLSTIFSKMRIKDSSFHVINHGTPGSGKSQSSLALLKQLDLGTEIIVDNTTTTKGLFQMFRDYPEMDILIDECSSLLRDPKTQDMVKLAMERKPLRWAKNNDVEETEPYQGNLIINTNVEINPAVIDRTYLNKTLVNKKMALEFTDYIFQKPVVNKEFTDYLKKILSDQKTPDLTKEELEYIKNFINKHISINDGELGYSRRIPQRILNYFVRTKKLFGKLDQEIRDFIEPIASLYIVNDKTPSFIEVLVGTSQIDKTELIHKISQEGGYSEGHARRLVKEAIEKGTLKQHGRAVQL